LAVAIAALHLVGRGWTGAITVGLMLSGVILTLLIVTGAIVVASDGPDCRRPQQRRSEGWT